MSFEDIGETIPSPDKLPKELLHRYAKALFDMLKASAEFLEIMKKEKPETMSDEEWEKEKDAKRRTYLESVEAAEKIEDVIYEMNINFSIEDLRDYIKKQF